MRKLISKTMAVATFLVGLISIVAFANQIAHSTEPILPTTQAKYEVSSEDVVYAKPDSLELLARIYRPKL